MPCNDPIVSCLILLQGTKIAGKAVTFLKIFLIKGVDICLLCFFFVRYDTVGTDRNVRRDKEVERHATKASG